MPKKRNPTNRQLPARWRYRRGVYWYRPRVYEQYLFNDKTEFPLGKRYSAALREFSCRISQIDGNYETMARVFDRYEVEVLPRKAAATQRSNIYSLRRLRAVFSDVHPSQIDPQTVYRYRDLCSQKESKKKANLDLEVLSHVFSRAIEWGIVKYHPIKGKVSKLRLDGRKRYVTDEEIVKFALSLPRKWQLYISLKLFTGRRKSELLRIKLTDLATEGIRFTNSKDTYDEFIVSWNSSLRIIVKEILTIPPRRIGSTHLFVNRMGKPYIRDDGLTSGFDSIWQRAMKKWVAAGNERFTEHDIRGKAGSDATSDGRAQELLRHKSTQTTRKHYRRKADIIEPL